MPNNIITPTFIAKGILTEFRNNSVLLKYVNRRYEHSFGQTGNKIGPTISIRRPVSVVSTLGPNITPNAPENDILDNYVNLTINTRRKVVMDFTTEELTMDVDDFRQRYMRPAAIQLANDVDFDLALFMKNNTYNLVGTPGTVPNSMRTYGQARVKLQNMACPMDDLTHAVLSPYSNMELVDGNKGLFNAPESITQQYKTGNMGRAGGMGFSMDQNLPTHITGAYGGTPQTNGAQLDNPYFSGNANNGTYGQNGANLLTPFPLITNGWSASRAVLNVGDVFSLPAQFSVNPVSRNSTGDLQQFVVQPSTINSNPEDLRTYSDTNGNAIVNILPRPIFSGPYQNMTSSTGNIPSGTLLQFFAEPNLSLRQNLVFHRDAFTLATVNLMKPAAGVWGDVVEEDGISIRILRQYEVLTDNEVTRVDIFYGMAALCPPWSCRVTE